MDKSWVKVLRKEKPYLPHEIITNILIMLTVKSLVRFQLVSKGWRDTISSRDFVDFHDERSSSSNPLILVAPGSPKHGFDLFAIDKWWDLSTTNNSIIHRLIPSTVDWSCEEFSHGGLVGFYVLNSSNPHIRIQNPARPSDECVVINFTTAFQARGSEICAVYYHPLLQEYCSLWKIRDRDLSKEYKLLSMGSKPSVRRIRNPFSYRVKGPYPLFINNHLYWMLKSEKHDDRYEGLSDILEFDIISEEFKVIHCPVPLNTKCKRHQVHMLDSDGVICYVLFLPSTITIWRLEDRVQELWTSINYTVSFKSDQRYTLNVIALVEGKLAFSYRDKLFACNLMEGTMKKYPKWYAGIQLSHKMTLASLKKCKSELYLDDDGNLVV